MVLVSCLIEIRLAIETLLKWIVDFWDFFVVEIKYSITKKKTVQCLKSKYIQMCRRHKKPLFSLMYTALLLSFSKQLLLSCQFLNLEVWRSNFERSHFTLANLFLVMDREWPGPTRRFILKKAETVDYFPSTTHPYFGCLHNKCPSLLTHSIP